MCFRWTRREECDFYRVVSTFGVEQMKTEVGAQADAKGKLEWTQFRTFARLDKKTDESLNQYFHSFVAMCRRVCRLQPTHGEGNELPFKCLGKNLVASLFNWIIRLCRFIQVSITHHGGASVTYALQNRPAVPAAGTRPHPPFLRRAAPPRPAQF